MAATHTSAGTFVGTIGVMYTAGWSFGWVLLSIPLSYWFMVAVLAPRFTRQKELTIPAFIETRYYGKGIRGLASPGRSPLRQPGTRSRNDPYWPRE